MNGNLVVRFLLLITFLFVIVSSLKYLPTSPSSRIITLRLIRPLDGRMETHEVFV